MGHEVDTMWSRVEVPWHYMRPGGTSEDQTKITEFAPKTAQELLKLARIEWSVQQMPVFTITKELNDKFEDESEDAPEIEVISMDDIIQLESNWANVRDDDGSVLGLVGDRMEPFQNIELAELVMAVVEGQDARFETAGALRGGEIVWVNCELLDAKKLPGGEECRHFINFMNHHNGKGSLTGMSTRVRTVCLNTLTAALRSAKSTWTIRHTESIRARVEEAQISLGLARKEHEAFVEMAGELVMRKFTEKDFVDVLGKLYPIPPEASPLAQKNATEKQELALAALKNSPNLADIRWTAWGAWNGLVEFVDHGMSYRSEEARMLSLMTPTGKAATFKQTALGLISAKADIKVPILGGVN